MLVNIENTTQKLCIIGNPVIHSKSPLVQNTMCAALGLDYIYLCQPVRHGELGQWIAAAKAAGYAGFNATMPHKVDLLAHMDALDEDAQLYQSVNTVCIKDGRLYGYNTDGKGFLQALTSLNFSPKGKRVVLLGAGGAAKAVALKLVQEGVSALTICNRTVEKATALCDFNPSVMSTALFDRKSLFAAVGEADLLVNCTSLGMGGTGGQFEDFSFLDALPQGAPVFDLIYHPTQTALLAQAKARGHEAVNGLGMLIHQAVFALEYFTSTSIDSAAMRPLLEQLL